MKRQVLFFVFIVAGLAAVLIAKIPTASPGLDRLPQVYAYLMNAEQMANGALTLPHDQLVAEAQKLSPNQLKEKCGALVDSTLKASTGAPDQRKPEILGYVKNAMLRLTLDRDEPHAGHLYWGHANPDKVPSRIQEFGGTIKEVLNKMKTS